MTYYPSGAPEFTPTQDADKQTKKKTQNKTKQNKATTAQHYTTLSNQFPIEIVKRGTLINAWPNLCKFVFT
jgi:hypothetical protein